jgi:transcriptional regulator with XRE-family HTH domain
MLADEFDVSTNTVWRWSSGQSDPRDETKIALAARLKTSIAFLMGETDDPSPQDAPPNKCLVDIINNNGTGNMAGRVELPPPEVISIDVGDIHMVFPKGTPSDVINGAIESARKGAKG